MPKEGVGLQPGIEDVRWLRIVDSAVRGEVPPYNRSRLVAMGLAEPARHAATLVVTEKGKKLLAANSRLTQ